MLRRRILLMASGGYRWIVAKFKMVTRGRTKITPQPSVQVGVDAAEHTKFDANMKLREAGVIYASVAVPMEAETYVTPAPAVTTSVKVRAKSLVRLNVVGYFIGFIHQKVKSYLYSKSKIITAPSEIIDIQVAMPNDAKLKVTPAPSEKIEQKVVMPNDAKLKVTQAESVSLENEAQMYTNVDIDAESKPSIDLAYSGQLANDVAIDVDSAEGVHAIHTVSSGNDVALDVTPAESSQITYYSGEATTSNIRFATWIYPTLENGILTIQQVHTATPKGYVLEVR